MNTPDSLAPQHPEGADVFFDMIAAVAPYLAWGVGVFGIVAIVAGIAQMHQHSLYGEPAGPAGGTIGGGLFMTIAGPVFGTIIGRTADTGPGAEESAATAAPPPTTAPADVAREMTESTPTDWTPLIWIGGGAAVLALTAYLITRTRSHIIDRRTAQRTLDTDFAAAQAIYDDVAAAYAAYIADPYAIFTRPLLDDLSEPRTAAFIDAFADATALRPLTCPDSSDRVQAFASAAHAARSAWDSADTHARTLGMGVSSEDDTRIVRRIRSALNLALDDSATGQERDTALQTVERLAAGLITIPDRIYTRAKTAIETTTRKQLTH